MDKQSVLPGQDCYFYYYSTCTRQDDCPYRHEPLALSNETECIYWKEGNCTKEHCIYRHMDVGAKKRKVTPCYWETQPQGCNKPHCAFLHQQPKDPVKQALPTHQPAHSSSTKKTQVDAGSIIVNPAKLEKVQKILDVTTLEEEEESGVRRLLVPAGSGALARQAVTGGIKARLGHKGGVKARLGMGQTAGEELDSEEEDLRRSAIKTLDLRSRIDGKIIINRKVIETDSGDTGDVEEESEGWAKKLRRKEKTLLRERKIEKMKEKLRLDKMMLKAEKKVRKQQGRDRMKSRVAAVIDNVSLSKRTTEDLPSASDYSDLESPDEDGAVLKVISRTDKAGVMRSDVLRDKLSAKTRLGISSRIEKEETGDLRSRMKERRDKIEKQNYASRVLTDWLGGREDTRLGKRTSDQLEQEQLSGDETKVSRKILKLESSKAKKKKKSEKKEKKSKRSRRSVSPSEEMNALEMAQEFSKEYEPIKARRLKISSKAEGSSDLSTSLLTLDTSQDDTLDCGVKVEVSGDVMKDLDEFLNE